MKVLIQGAGPAGLTLALALKRHKIETTIVERAAPGRSGGYVVGLRHNGLRAMEALGLKDALIERQISLSNAHYYRTDGRPFVKFNYAKLLAAAPGGMLAILRDDIMSVLEDAAKDLDIRYETTVRSVEELTDTIRVSFSDDTGEEFDAVIAADGYRSALRKMLFDPQGNCTTELGYRVAAWRYAPNKTQEKSVSGVSEVGRQATVYRLRDGSAETLLCWQDKDVSRHDTAKKQQTVMKVFGECPEPIQGAISSCEDWSESFADTMALVEMSRWSKGRVALLGDAAWSLALISGEGPSTAMAGAMVLAEELAKAEDVGTAFNVYEDRLRPVVTKLQASAKRVAGQFVPASGFGMTMQKLMMPLMTSRLLLPLVLKRSLAPMIAFSETLPEAKT